MDAQQQKQVAKEKLNHDFFYCWVTADERVPDHPDDQKADNTTYYKFNFQFNLWQRNDNDSMVNQTFQANYTTIKSIYDKAGKAKIYFAQQEFPLVYTERSSQLQDDLCLMDKYMVWSDIKCKGPSSSWTIKRFKSSATEDDLQELSDILCKLFNSPKWVTDPQNDLYSLFSISDDKNVSFNQTHTISNSIENNAALLLNKLKVGTCPNVPIGLSWDYYNEYYNVNNNNGDPVHKKPQQKALGVLPDDAFMEEEKLEQQCYEAKECRLNNPNSCWKPRMDHLQPQHGQHPWLQIRLNCKTRIKRLRVQPSNDLQSYITLFDLHYGSREDTVLNHVITDIRVTKTLWKNNRDYEEIILERVIYAKYIRIVPKSWRQSIALRLELYGEVNWNYRKLISHDLLRNMEFYELTVVTRTLRASSLTNHWALKFEGKQYLLTIELYAKHKILVSIERNTCVGQKIFWYSVFGDKDRNYTYRWGTLFPLAMCQSNIRTPTINGKCIGLLIKRWHSIYTCYDERSNNCQHFVRDILSLFSKQAATYFVGEMEYVKVDRCIHPLFESCDEYSEASRMNSIRIVLQKEYNQNKIKINHIDVISKLKQQHVQEADNRIFSQKLLTCFMLSNTQTVIKEMNNFITFVSDIEMDSDAIIYDLSCDDDEQSFIYVEYFNRAKKKQYIQMKDFVTRYKGNLNKNGHTYCKIQRRKEEFKKWLCDDLNFDDFLPLFEKNKLDDIRQITTFDDETLKEIGISLSSHRKWILEAKRRK